MMAAELLERFPGKVGRLFFLMGFLFLLFHPVSMAFAVQSSADAILLQVDRNLQPQSRELFFQITNRLPNGRENNIFLFAAKGRNNRAIALILGPDKLKGRAILRLGDEVWLHIPGELELRLSSLGQSLVGGVFNNADILMTDMSADYKAALLEENKEFLLLQLTPRSEHLPYTKMILRVDRKSLLPVRLDQYGSGGALLKTLTFGTIEPDSGFLRPRTIRTESGLNNRYSSTWRLGTIKERVFPEEVLTKKLLPRIGILIK